MEYKQNINKQLEAHQFNLNESFKVIFDSGKPYEEEFKGEEELRAGLLKFYQENKEQDYFYDVKVFLQGEDISESQRVSEIIGEILENDN